MPIKYKPSERVLNRTTKVTTTVNHYMHTIPTSQLVQDIKDARMTPKRLAKIRIELVRRYAVIV
jgi:hypothetical protein